jgi:hypothetical protein
MIGVPILIEAEETLQSPELRLCWKIAVKLVRRKVAPLLVSTPLQIADAIKKAHAFKTPPAIFVINTFGTKTILPEIDPLIGELPVLYFRRSLYAGQSGLMSYVPEVNHSMTSTTTILRSLTPRLSSIWYYGSKNSEEVSERAAGTIASYIADGDFRQIEIHGRLEQLEYGG